jgi:hypothetical protein
MITGTLKSKLDKLWLECLASATLPPRHWQIFMLLLSTTCVTRRRSKPISMHVSSAPRKLVNALSTIEGTCEPAAALARTPPGELTAQLLW